MRCLPQREEGVWVRSAPFKLESVMKLVRPKLPRDAEAQAKYDAIVEKHRPAMERVYAMARDAAAERRRRIDSITDPSLRASVSRSNS